MWIICHKPRFFCGGSFLVDGFSLLILLLLQLRLSLEDKQMEDITQSIVDRCILDEIYKFLVHTLPCSFNFPEDQHKLVPRRRKVTHSEDIGSMFLTPVISQSPIILTPSPEDSFDGKNYNFNNTSPFWRTFLKQQGGRVSPGGSLSSSPSPIALLERRLSSEGLPPAKRMATELISKVGRPRSKSMAADKPKKKTPMRSRFRSSDQSAKNSSNTTFTPISFDPEALNGNSNNNNNNSNVSPPSVGMLSIPVPQFRPLPITPPRNPYEDQPIMDTKLDPKTLRHLQRK